MNLGDTYSRNPQKGDYRGWWGKHAWITDELPLHSRPVPEELPAKNLVGIPWRVAFALQADGWWLRSDIIWHKPNPMPASVTDRPTVAHEYVFLLSKSARYFYDGEAIREPMVEYERRRRLREAEQGLDTIYAVASDGQTGQQPQGRDGAVRTSKRRGELAATRGRNKRTVWTIATHPYPGAHFASFPPALVEPMIKAGTSEWGCCPACGAGWERVVKHPDFSQQPKRRTNHREGEMLTKGKNYMTSAGQAWQNWRNEHPDRTVGWRPTCHCYDDDYCRDFPRVRSTRKRQQQDVAGRWLPRARRRPGKETWPVVPAVVLDPFGGAGTTGLVADRLGRSAILVELNPEYARMAEVRIREDAGPMFARVGVVELGS